MAQRDGGSPLSLPIRASIHQPARPILPLQSGVGVDAGVGAMLPPLEER